VSLEQVLDQFSRADRFKGTIYAMNTLPIHKGVYTQEEFQQLFVEWALNQGKNPIDEFDQTPSSYVSVADQIRMGMIT
jgi:hypothetical protein